MADIKEAPWEAARIKSHLFHTSIVLCCSLLCDTPNWRRRSMTVVRCFSTLGELASSTWMIKSETLVREGQGQSTQQCK